MTESVMTDMLIINKLGLHARAAAQFVTEAARFEADILVRREGKEVNGKSIMGVMMLAAAQGTTIEVSASGADAQSAILALDELVKNRFGEDE